MEGLSVPLLEDRRPSEFQLSIIKKIEILKLYVEMDYDNKGIY